MADQPPQSNEEFLAEMKRRREAAERVALEQSVTNQNTPQSTPSSEEKGFIGLLIRTGLVSTSDQAKKVLYVILVIVIGLIIWDNLP